MKKSILLAAAIGLSVAVLTGCGEQYGYEDAETYTLNKCDESDETLVDVGVGGPWSYDEDNSNEGVDMFLDHEDGGFIYISNEAIEPLYSYTAEYVGVAEVDSMVTDYMEEIGCEDYECDWEVIGTAFDGSDLILAEESFTIDGEDMECTYLMIQYSDGQYVEFLTVDFSNMDTDDWTNEDYVDLARNLFGK